MDPADCEIEAALAHRLRTGASLRFPALDHTARGSLRAHVAHEGSPHPCLHNMSNEIVSGGPHTHNPIIIMTSWEGLCYYCLCVIWVIDKAHL